jgi:hypothetical protein
MTTINKPIDLTKYKAKEQVRLLFANEDFQLKFHDAETFDEVESLLHDMAIITEDALMILKVKF